MEPQNNETNQPDASHSIGTLRKTLVLFLLAILFVGHAYCVLKGEEYWPFSHYPMYSMVHKDSWADDFLIGTLREDPDVQVPVSYMVYDRPISVKVCLEHMSQAMREDPKKAEDLRQTLIGLGRLYLDGRGGHRPDDFKEIGTLSLVQVAWKRDPNGDYTKADEIDQQVVMQVQLPVETIATMKGEG